MPIIEMVVAVAENGIIGKDGDMPWRLPSDLKHFKQVTMGCPIIMGRATWDSIGRPLPGRLNIVISRTAPALPDGVVAAATPQAALKVATEALGEAVSEAVREAEADTRKVMIIGGGQIYKIFEAQASTIHLTQVHATPAGDTSFALQQPDDWRET
ncbi:MAG: dihydrofolate reductase, partial [PS1 clade bacterium]|nr:dihydrofolate reductase [PS1 clade bacterium]